MRKQGSRILVAVCVLLSGAYLCAGGNVACGSLASEAAFSAADMCFIFDCTDGMFGGLIDPCANIRGTDGPTGDFAEGEIPGNPLFVDCLTLEAEQD